jgi:hypothetical protein
VIALQLSERIGFLSRTHSEKAGLTDGVDCAVWVGTVGVRVIRVHGPIFLGGERKYYQFSLQSVLVEPSPKGLFARYSTHLSRQMGQDFRWSFSAVFALSTERFAVISSSSVLCGFARHLSWRSMAAVRVLPKWNSLGHVSLVISQFFVINERVVVAPEQQWKADEETGKLPTRNA